MQPPCKQPKSCSMEHAGVRDEWKEKGREPTVAAMVRGGADDVMGII